MKEVINAFFQQLIFFFSNWLNLLLRILTLHLSQYIIFLSTDVFTTQEVGFILSIHSHTLVISLLLSFFGAHNEDLKVAHGKKVSAALSSSQIS